MRYITRYIGIALPIILLALIIGMTACGGGPTPPAEQGPTGAELVKKMEDSVKAVKSAHCTVDFQIASAQGPVKGTVEFWGERPGKMRAEVKGELPSIDGVVAVSDGQMGWAYNPREKLVVVADKSQYKSQLRDQPELRAIVEFLQKMNDRGFADTEAVNQGVEQINGRNCYKVQVTYTKSSDPNLDLSGVTAIFWIDQETSLPQRVELAVDREGFTASGFAVLKGDITKDQPIDAAKFTFTPPEGATVLDMSELPPLPAMSDLPKVQ